ncbi:complex I NDUFA9 subunit family protein [Tropicimonas sp. IMCC34011]|uniref:complex I NDUFA9 subunit family protein n=1 Tax=Tropicimonas sp. IMCC34011 TaxID=2248759 RepID=UPI000E2529C6|nr:complex I NDUFA9 subunit family protein [Tropicimonas sp. IMCC34011]
MTRLVTIFGGSGFVGRYIARRAAAEGWRVRVACRRPEEAGFVRTYGVVGQVEPIFCNIRDDASVAQALNGADAVANCVGVLDESGKNTFEAVQDEGATRIARLAAADGVRDFVQISAIGAEADSDSAYARTKAAGEAGVLQHMPQAVILRPSIVFGAEDEFFNRFAGMTRFGPVLPVVGGDTKFQPVWVDDVARAAMAGLSGTAKPGIYELGGPDTHTFRELMQQMLHVIRKNRFVANVPFGIANLMASGFGAVRALTFGLIKGPITHDQVANLRQDNVVSGTHMGFDDLGIQPAAMEAVLPDYLWRFRPSGQYSTVKESAKKLRNQI